MISECRDKSNDSDDSDDGDDNSDSVDSSDINNSQTQNYKYVLKFDLSHYDDLPITQFHCFKFVFTLSFDD